MTRIFDAECENSIVKIGDHEITRLPPTIITQGKKGSTGVFLLYGNKSFYVASNTSDIVDFLDHVASVLGTISSSMTELAAAIGGAPLILSTAAKVVQVNAIASQLSTMKENLK